MSNVSAAAADGKVTPAIPSGQAAIDAIQELIDALADDQVGIYNLDAAYASTILSAAIARIEAYYPALEKLPDFDMASIQRLRLLVAALLHSNGLVLSHSPETSNFDALAIEARALRESLLIAATALVDDKLVSEQTVEDIRAGHGVYDLINDLTALRAMMEQHRDASTVRAERMQRTIELIEELPRRYAQHLGKDPALAPLLTQRKKIAALIIHAYGEAQAGLSFVRRRHGDANEIAPSIYVPRGLGKKGGDKGENTDPTAKPAPAPAPVPAKPANPLLPSDNPFDNKS